MPPKKTSTKKKKAAVDSITSVELIDTTPVAFPPSLPEVTAGEPVQVLSEPVQVLSEPLQVASQPVQVDAQPEEKTAELQAEPKELDEIVVVGDFEAPVKNYEPDDIRDAAGDADEAFSFPPPDSQPIPAERRPEWLKYEQDNPLFDNLRSRRTDIQENQIKMLVPTHTLRGMEDSDVEADIGDMV